MHIKDIGTEELIAATQKAVSKFDSDSVALLTATGKIELFFRNLLALELLDSLRLEDGQEIIREWKRHDLVLLENNEPILILEGKAWIHADAINPKKLDAMGAVIRVGLEDDIKKLRDTQSKYPNSKKAISIILSSVDVSEGEERLKGLIGYSSMHEGAIKTAGSFENLLDQGRTKLTEFLTSQPHLNSIKRAPLFEGKFRGMDVYVEGYFAFVD